MTASLISLSQAKSWLSYPTPTQPHADDPKIQGVIDAVAEIVEHYTGLSVPRRFTERTDGGSVSVWTRQVPILSVESVVENWGPISFELNYQDVSSAPIVGSASGAASATTSTFAYSIDSHELGQITRRSAGNVAVPFVPGLSSVEINYTAGRSAVPAAVTLATQEAVAHIWQASQQRSMNMSNSFVEFDTVTGTRIYPDRDGSLATWVGVPQRIIALLLSERIRLPCIA